MPGRFSPKWIIGKRVADVIVEKSQDGMWLMHDYRIVFEDGSSIAFMVEEPDKGMDYGVQIVYSRPSRRRESSQ